MIDQKLNLGLIYEQNKRTSKKNQNELLKKIPPIFQCSKLENYKVLLNVKDDENKANGVYSNPKVIENFECSYSKKDTGIKSINDSNELKEQVSQRCPTSVKIIPLKIEYHNISNLKFHCNLPNSSTVSETFCPSSQRSFKVENKVNNPKLIISNTEFHPQDSLNSGNDFKLNRYYSCMRNLHSLMI